MSNVTYNVCVKCVMDTSDSGIHFDDEGICNHCRSRDELLSTLPSKPIEREARLQTLIQKIKNSRRAKEYDCLIGISGGVDSSYLVHECVQLGLRPLLVHFDNGWNTELAVKNIQRIVKKLNLDLVTEVADWEEFRDIQRSLFFSDVVDLELLSDQAIVASLFRVARKYGIKHIVSGHNVQTETHLPNDWTWMKFDRRNILDIHKSISGRKIIKTPLMGILSFVLHQKVLGLKFFGL